MTNASLETKGRALQLRSILNQLSHISYSFAKLNKEYPFDYLDERNLQILIHTYEELIESALPSLERYAKELPKSNNGVSESQQNVGVTNV